MTELLNSWFKVDLGEGAFYAGFGFLFVFLGIALLILIFTLLGIFMKKFNERRAKRGEAPKPPKPRHAAPPAEVPGPASTEEEVPPEVVAVIAAAIAAYYEGTRAKCDFVVRRIRKLS